MKSAPRYIAVFPAARQVSQYVTNCRLVLKRMTGNAHFPSPTPALAQVATHLDTLDLDEQGAQQGGKGATEQRDASLALVESDMRLLKAYVQAVADTRPYAEAEAVILSAGMSVKRKSSRAKPPLHVKQGKASGQVVVQVRALPRPVQYLWQMSTNLQVWTDLPETFNAETTVEGLAPTSVVSFRVRTRTRHGLSEWSQPVTIIVH